MRDFIDGLSFSDRFVRLILVVAVVVILIIDAWPVAKADPAPIALANGQVMNS